MARKESRGACQRRISVAIDRLPSGRYGWRVTGFFGELIGRGAELTKRAAREKAREYRESFELKL